MKFGSQGEALITPSATSVSVMSKAARGRQGGQVGQLWMRRGWVAEMKRRWLVAPAGDLDKRQGDLACGGEAQHIGGATFQAADEPFTGVFFSDGVSHRGMTTPTLRQRDFSRHRAGD